MRAWNQKTAVAESGVVTESMFDTSGLTPEVLVDALFDYLSRECGHDVAQVRQTLLADYLASGARARPACLREVLPAQPAPMPRHKRALSERQDRHAAPTPAVIPA